MSVTFTKLFSSITESTIWAEPDHTRIVWVTMLAMADHAGRVWASIPGLANRARVSLERCEDALRTLMSPDKYSRTKDHDGRRVAEMDGGWRLLNHSKYKSIRDEESIKESKRRYINERRARERADAEMPQPAGPVEPCRTPSNAVDGGRSNAEAEAEAYTESEAEVLPASSKHRLTTKTAQASQAKPARGKEPAPSSQAWAAYSAAYERRYGSPPVRNAKVNGQLAQLVARLGAEEAPEVASFFVGHQRSLYVSAMHAVDLLLRDAEKLRTEWATGRKVMAKDASEADRVAADGGMWGRVAETLKAKGIECKT